MKKYLTALAALAVIVLFASAQVPAPPADAGRPSSEMQNCPSGSECSSEDRGESGRRHEWAGREDCGWSRGEKSCPFSGPHRFVCIVGMLLLLMAGLHGLLAYIVGHDVAEAGLSKLWILVALAAGLPGTAVYALFRIGNMVAGRSSNPSVSK